MFTIKQVSRMVGVPHWRIAYAHEHGQLAEPSWVCGRRIYNEEDVQRVRQYFVDRAKNQLEAINH